MEVMPRPKAACTVVVRLSEGLKRETASATFENHCSVDRPCSSRASRPRIFRACAPGVKPSLVDFWTLRLAASTACSKVWNETPAIVATPDSVVIDCSEPPIRACAFSISPANAASWSNPDLSPSKVSATPAISASVLNPSLTLSACALMLSSDELTSSRAGVLGDDVGGGQDRPATAVEGRRRQSRRRGDVPGGREGCCTRACCRPAPARPARRSSPT